MGWAKSRFVLAAVCLAATAFPQRLAAAAIQSVDFGSAAVRAASPLTKTISFAFSGLSSQPAFKLNYNLDYKLTRVSCNSGWTSCTVTASFSPQYPGLRQDGLFALDSAGRLLATAFLKGTGTGPQVAFNPGTVAILQSQFPSNNFYGLAVDPAGNVYFGDNTQHVVEKLAPGGDTPVIVAGRPGAIGGDGGSATSAGLGIIRSLSLDPAGNLFIVDGAGIQKVDAATGIIATLTTEGGYIALDDRGNLYFTEQFDIKKIDAETGALTTVTFLSGDDGFANGIAIGPDGDLYISQGDRVVKFDFSTGGSFKTVAGMGSYGYSGDGGVATQAQLRRPTGLAFDAVGNLYIADSGNNCVRKVDGSTGVITTVAGKPDGVAVQDGVSANSVQFPLVDSIAVDSAGNLFFTGTYQQLLEVQFASPTMLFPWPGSFGAAPTANVSLVNTGNQPLQLSSQEITGPFRLQTGVDSECKYPSQLAAGTGCKASIAYVLGQGTQAGAYTVIDNALNQSGAQQNVSLQVAFPQAKLSTTNLTFGIGGVGLPGGNQWVTLSNLTGKVPLKIAGYTFTGSDAGDFSLDREGLPTSVGTQSNSYFDILFDPKALGTRTADLVITTNAPDSPEIIHLTGTGVAPPNLVIGPASADFGNQKTGTTSTTKTFTLANTGEIGPGIQYIFLVFGNGFSDTPQSTCNYMLFRSSSCTITIDFHPLAPGAASGQLLIQSYDFQSYDSKFRLIIPLTGNGVGRVTHKAHDFDGDGKADYALWSSSDGNWRYAPNFSPQSVYTRQWGVPGDIPVSGDFDGDGKNDYAVWRPSDGTWYIFPSRQPASPLVQQWGAAGDIPISGDFDGDGKADYAVWRPSDGTWYILPSSSPSTPIVQQWGWAGDIPVSADFDGDGKADFAVFRPYNGTWYIIPSSAPDKPYAQQWGFDGDIPVSADFDGDGKDDIAVWRPSNGTWYIIPSSAPNSPYAKQWGFSGDVPIPDDFDGDGKADFAVRRPSTQTWFVLTSSNPDTPIVVTWGDATDQVPK